MPTTVLAPSVIPRGGRFDHRYIRGDRVVRDFAIRENNRTTVVNLTGWTWKAEVRAKPEPSSPLLATMTVNVTSAALGELTVTLAEADSDDDALLGAWWDLQRVLPYPLTYIRGRMRPRKDVTI